MTTNPAAASPDPAETSGRADVVGDPAAPRLTVAPTGALAPWAPRFLTIFAVVMMVLMLAVCAPALAGADSTYLEALTPLLMWAPLLAVVVLHFALGRPVPLLRWAGVRGGSVGRVLLAILALLGVFAGIAALVVLITSAFGFVGLQATDDAAALAVMVLPLVVMTMLMALGEEFAWRGHIASTLAPWGFWRASQAIGAFWSLWHLPLTLAYAIDGVVPWREVPATTVNLLLASLLLAAARYLTRSVWPAVAGHAMMNTVLVFAYSNLMTPTSTLSDAAYWGYTVVAWVVWGAVVAAAGRLVVRRG